VVAIRELDIGHARFRKTDALRACSMRGSKEGGLADEDTRPTASPFSSIGRFMIASMGFCSTPDRYG
jgi:hypothetical protein